MEPNIPNNRFLIITVLLLISIGVIMVYSASSFYAESIYEDSFYFLKKQIFYIILGFICMYIIIRLSYKTYEKFLYKLLLFTIVLLLLAKFGPFSRCVNGSCRWIDLGVFTFEPSELAKIVLIISLAYTLSKKTENKTNRFEIYLHKITKFIDSSFLPLFFKEFIKITLVHLPIPIILMGLIVIEPSLGNIILMGTVTLSMMYIGGVKARYILLMVGIGCIGVFILALLEPYRWVRLKAFIDPWQYDLTTGYHIIHSMMAFRSGSIFGDGLGIGKLKLILPESHTDFIISILGEEAGLIGVILVLGMFIIIIINGTSIALRANKDNFAMLTAGGITLLIGLQSLINLSVNMALMPTTGLPLPFISYGGSSMIMSLISIGILINISRTIASEYKKMYNRYHEDRKKLKLFFGTIESKEFI